MNRKTARSNRDENDGHDPATDLSIHCHTSHFLANTRSSPIFAVVKSSLLVADFSQKYRYFKKYIYALQVAVFIQKSTNGLIEKKNHLYFLLFPIRNLHFVSLRSSLGFTVLNQIYAYGLLGIKSSLPVAVSNQKSVMVLQKTAF